jgi:hypothetical protein
VVSMQRRIWPFSRWPQRPLLLVSTNAGVWPDKLRIPRGRGERLEKPVSERSLLAQRHPSLEELLASCVVRQVMKSDGVDPSDVRKLIASVANTIAASP